MTKTWIRPLFLIGGIYDAVFGLAFFFAHEQIFVAFEVTPPNHPAYVEFPALLLIIFGAMFIHIAMDPARLRVLIPYAMALKVAYVGLAFWYQMTLGIPALWVPWAWVDLGFLVAFGLAWMAVAPGRATS